MIADFRLDNQPIVGFNSNACVQEGRGYWQAWMHEKQPRLLVIWGKYDLSFDLSEPEAYRRDVPDAHVHILDAGHFALDTAADEIAALIRGLIGSSG